MTTGVYQLKQAYSYTEEHTSQTGQCEIVIHKENDGILKAKIRSRHTAAAPYNLWIEYGPGLESIKGWYCKCKSCSGVVGCCAHKASVLWFLGYFRHQPKDKKQIFKSHYISCLTDACVKDWDSSS